MDETPTTYRIRLQTIVDIIRKGKEALETMMYWDTQDSDIMDEMIERYEAEIQSSWKDPDEPRVPGFEEWEYNQGNQM